MVRKWLEEVNGTVYHEERSVLRPIDKRNTSPNIYFNIRVFFNFYIIRIS